MTTALGPEGIEATRKKGSDEASWFQHIPQLSALRELIDLACIRRRYCNINPSF